MKITIFRDSDLKKAGGFKKKNKVKEMNKDEFKTYIKTNNFNLTKGYIDLIGFISNGEKFRCYYKNMVVGVTNLIEEAEQWKKKMKEKVGLWN